MKATGIVRKLDDLGRLCLPKELRRSLDINEKDGLEICVDGDSIILRKSTPGNILKVTPDAVDDVRQLKMSYKQLGLTAQAEIVENILIILGLD